MALKPRDLLPHRPPFLFVDQLLSVTPMRCAVGLKYLTENEAIYLVEGQEVSLLPSLLVEFMAQVGALAFLADPEHRGYHLALVGIEECAFHALPEPGDVLHLQAERLALRKNFGQMKASCCVNGRPVAEGVFSFAFESGPERQAESEGVQGLLTSLGSVGMHPLEPSVPGR